MVLCVKSCKRLERSPPYDQKSFGFYMPNYIVLTIESQ